MGDPMFVPGVTLAIFLIVVIKVVIAFAVLMPAVMLMIWFERKIISDMQNRIGPNRAGPWGILQTMADGIKLIFKEDLIPTKADRFVFKLAPFLALLPALLTFMVVPIGNVVTIAHHRVELQVADPQIGILFVLAMSGIAVYGTMLAGWSSGSKYPLLGAIRGSAQMISYEAAMGLSVAAIVLVDGTLSTRSMVLDQTGRMDQSAPWFHWHWLVRVMHYVPHWNIFTLGFVPFIIFMIASTAELNRPPFDLVEGEQELVGGFHTEYTSFRFALFFLAEFMNTITMSAIAVTLFLGGPDGPIPDWGPAWLYPILWFLAKTVAFLFFQVWLRATLPRLRYDQLMNLGWKFLIPLSLAWLMIVAAFRTLVRYGFAVACLSIWAGIAIWIAAQVGKRDNGAHNYLEDDGGPEFNGPGGPGRAHDGGEGDDYGDDDDDDGEYGDSGGSTSLFDGGLVTVAAPGGGLGGGSGDGSAAESGSADTTEGDGGAAS